MKKTRYLFVLALAAMTIFASSCSKTNPQSQTENTTYNFTLIFFSSPGNPFWTKIIMGAEEMAKTLNCKVNMQFAYNDPIKQNNIIETAISNKIDGLGIGINTDDAYNESVKKAIDSGVPVIAFNIDHSKGREGNARMAYIGLDCVKGGEIIAKRLVQEAKLKEGDFVVCPVEHPDAVYAIQQYEGIKKVFEPLGIKSEVLNTGSTSLEESLNRLTQYLLGHKDTDAVLAMGGMPMEVTPQAIADASMNIPNAGFDITKEILNNILTGKTIAALEQEPFYQGAFTVMQLYYYKKYGLMPCDIATGPVIIDKNNAAVCLELADTVR